MSHNLHTIPGVLQCHGVANLMCASFAASFSLRMFHFSTQHFRFRTLNELTDTSKIKYIRHRL